MNLKFSATIGFLLGLLAGSALAAELPQTIVIPKGLNLGSTSFFDGFGGTTEGWAVVEYGRYDHIDAINDAQGSPNPVFRDPQIEVYSSLTQLIYTSSWQPFGGDAVGFSAALPVVDFSSKFAAGSRVTLSNNGSGIGDLVWGPLYQSRVTLRDDRPYFTWRAQFIVMSPTGQMNDLKSMNQGCGYWAVNPYVTFTLLPFPAIELSNRLNYQYNFPGSTFSNPPPIPHLVYRDGQAGQIVYDNFDASYALRGVLFFGVNGYYVRQLSDDATNGQEIPHSLVEDLYLGPGGRYVFGKSDTLNLNLYLPLISRNDSAGPKLNFQYTHRFP
jgi:hypothetical protein